MGRRRDFLDEYASDSDDSDEDDELLLPGEEGDEAGHRQKRRRTGRDAKEAAALGVLLGSITIRAMR